MSSEVVSGRNDLHKKHVPLQHIVCVGWYDLFRQSYHLLAVGSISLVIYHRYIRHYSHQSLLFRFFGAGFLVIGLLTFGLFVGGVYDTPRSCFHIMSLVSGKHVLPRLRAGCLSIWQHHRVNCEWVAV